MPTASSLPPVTSNAAQAVASLEFLVNYRTQYACCAQYGKRIIAGNPVASDYFLPQVAHPITHMVTSAI
ncbi:MAG: hypothetical protein Q9P01_21650 [Anaerolineae bacterium]|nr:hypothetical protein [Anaerolineae bacterium]